MAKTTKTAWGIDVGNCTLKALRLRGTAEQVEVVDFAVIEHEKILSQPDLDPQERTEMIRKALAKFMDEHEVSGSTVVVSVPGQSSFARFIKLPPVENKRIPEIVKFEATQQIPFDIHHVEWDWQSFHSPNSTEVEVGIFAIKKELVGRVLQPFTNTGCPVHIVQMAPMALYNFLYQDQPRLRDASSKEAVILLDIGAENTDLVIADGTRVWQRSIPIGGNQFTAAVQKAFKLGFVKAETIKRSASTSKYARQIFQAMRSVFADLAAEVQRSLGFYSSSNRDVQFRQVLALGNTMKLPGLVKFLQQSLSLPVKRLSSFETLNLSSEISAAQFSDNLPSFTVAYGLAAQGLDKGAIGSNLLPRDLARQTQWQRKRPWFVAAASIFLATALIFLFQAFSVRSDINSSTTEQNRDKINMNKDTITAKSSEKSTLENSINSTRTELVNFKKYYQRRDTIPLILQAIRDCVPNEKNTTDPQQQALHKAFAEGDRETLTSIPRHERAQIFLHSIKIIPVDDLSQPFDKTGPSMTQSGPGLTTGVMPDMTASTMPGAAGVGGPGYVVIVEGTTPHKDGFEFLQTPGAGRENWGFIQKLRYLGKTDAVIAAEIKARQEYRTAQQNQPAGGVMGGVMGGYPQATGGYPGVGGVNPAAGGVNPAAGGVNPAAAGGALSGYPGVDAGADPMAGGEPIPSEPVHQDYPGHISPSDLPFETYVEPKSLSDTLYFDASNFGWLSPSDGLSYKASQPEISTIGVLKADQTAPISTGAVSTTGGITSSASSNLNVNRLDVYLDLFTREVISETYILDAEGNQVRDRMGRPQVQTHDFWFRIDFKLRMKPQY